MGYEVLARKWRPQQFNDVVGQEHVTQTLRNAIMSDRIAHAYLFVGPRGIGKTSIARIFAKALNCRQRTDANPCDKCDSCIEIMAGTSLDVIEIDGASNNGVDQVRDLRDTVRYAPTSAPFKIYIIDEVHMLSTAAFNALLKTLEEPPAHVKFIFATTEPEKILATIVSRCQRFDLRRISVPQIIDRLRVISKDENISVDDDALLAIARGAEGGLRDAESALDQLISFKGKNIGESDVLSVFGLVSRSMLEDLAGKILGGNIRELLEIVNEMDSAGKDLQRVVLELMQHFRNLLVHIHAGSDSEGSEITASQSEVLTGQAAMTDTERVLRIIDILSEAENRMKFALSRRTLLETALIRCARAATVVSIEDILARIDELKKNVSSDSDSIESNHEDLATVVETANDSSLKRTESSSLPVNKEDKKTPAISDYSAELAYLQERWNEIITKIERKAIGTRSSLSDAQPISVKDDCVVVAFDAEFANEIENFSTMRNKKAVEHVLQLELKRPVSADFVIKTLGADEPVVLPTESQSAAHTKKIESATETPAKKKGKFIQDWLKDESVQKALDVFSGTIVEVRE